MSAKDQLKFKKDAMCVALVCEEDGGHSNNCHSSSSNSSNSNSSGRKWGQFGNRALALCIVLGVLFFLLVLICVGAMSLSIVALRKASTTEQQWPSKGWSDNSLFTEQQQQQGEEEEEEEEDDTLFQIERLMERTGEMHFLHPHKQREDRGTDFPANTATATATATAAAVSVDDDDDDNDAVKPGYARIQRNANEAEELCSSSNETDAKPLAHIVGPTTSQTKAVPDDYERFSILSKGWVCEKTSNERRAMVRGGMKFHKSSGFLEFPVSGVYYIYHQITFRLDAREKPNTRRLARTRLVACIPGDDCTYIAEDGEPYMQSEAGLSGSYGRSKFQGGLFFFPAGARVAVLVWNELYDRYLRAIRYDDYSYHTYMGAYLVDQDQE